MGGSTVSATYTIAAHFPQRVPHSWLQSILQLTRKAWMGLPHQQSVTQPVIARYVRLSGSPCRLSRAHSSSERVHAGGQRVHAGYQRVHMSVSAA